MVTAAGDEMTTDELKREKARKLRFKKPICKNLNLYEMRNSVSEMLEMCDEVRYWTDTENETLLNALDGNEEEEFEFKLMFSDLSAELERFSEDIYSRWYSPMDETEEVFDDILVSIGAGDYTGGYLGWDSYEGDYFGLDVSDEYITGEKAKKIKRMTKDQMIEAYSYVLKTVYAYIGLCDRFTSIRAALDILRNQNVTYLKEVKRIEELHAQCDALGWWHHGPEQRELDRLLSALPQEAWL